MTRTYTTDHGHAHASYDGSTWLVQAHPDNDPGFTDQGCPQGGHSTTNGVAFEAWPDEAGFRGRHWRTGANTPDLLGSHNPIGMDDQWPSLKAIAEAAIEVSWQRSSEDRPCYCNDHFTEHTVAEHRVLDQQQEERSMEQDALTEQRLAANRLEEAQMKVDADGTSVTPDEARALVARWADLMLPTGLVVMQFGYGDVDDWVGLQEPEDVEDGRPLCLFDETLGSADPDPVAFLQNMRLAAEDPDVAEQVAAGYSVGEAECIVAHDSGAHGDESEPECPRCRDLYDDEAYEWSRETVKTIDLTPGNEEQANILTMLSEQFARQGMVPNAFGAMASVLDLARCLQANDPERLARVIESLRRDDANWGPDTPAGKAARRRREEEVEAYEQQVGDDCYDDD